MPHRDIALWLLFIQGLIGAFDTVYYHEWRARLSVMGRAAASELRLHAARSMIYTVIFAVLPRLEAQGFWAFLLAALLIIEVVITIADFVVEDRVRAPLGGVYPGERATHTVMAIIHGAILAHLLPLLWKSGQESTVWVLSQATIPDWLQVLFILMAVGVFVSGVRDFFASTGASWAHWPWRKS